MKFLSSIVLVAACTSYVLAGLEDAKHSIVLGANNFDSKIQEPEVGSLVAFFAPCMMPHLQYLNAMTKRRRVIRHCKSLEPTWTKIGKTFESETKCNIGHLDADNAKNKAIASRYGVSGYPTIKFLPSGGKPAVDYSGPRTEEAFTTFLNEQCGTHRQPGGALSETAGRLPQLDELAAAYLPSSLTERTDLLAKAKTLAATLGGPATAVYLKVFEKLQDNEDYLVKESERIKKLLEKKTTLASTKIDELQIKQNILKAFQAVKGGAHDAKVKAEKLVNQAKARVDL